MAGKKERAVRQEAPAIPNVPLLQRLQAELETYSTADRAIAAYILGHYPTLAFETAMTLAMKVGVSEITIGRFTRKLGYRNFKTMKNELKDGSEEGFPWLVGDQLRHFVDSPGLPDEADERVLSWYELRPVGTDRVAGHDAVVLSLQARDPLRFSFRLWVERHSHLLLRHLS